MMSKSPEPSYETTHRVRDHCLCLNAQRMARILSRHFDEAFRPLGLTSGQFSLLMSLNRPEPPTVGSVADLLAMDRTTLTAALKPLGRQGLVRVEPDAKDRRSRRLILTSDGRALLAEATEIWRATHARLDLLLTDLVGADLPEMLRLVSGSLAGGAKQVAAAAPPSRKQRDGSTVS